ncbi:glycosyltransferase family 4 protein [Actinoplanes aureus]|uniref:Glycosyltransferase family 4 protein n=1 Tax=Actinoplanes aureus TaxID=2792083 RepID=A0A931G1Z9_9ACTN|nr:glycosyltransferase family 4 protein [Actinoplanes aureus]MBG0565681.1 glycosyltransferase family 4 protein [Actinoplanes aureus]
MNENRGDEEPVPTACPQRGTRKIAMSIFDSIGNPHYSGGGPVVVHEVATRLATRYDVVVYTASHRGSRADVRDGVRYVYLPVGWAGPRAGQVLFQLMLPFVATLAGHGAWIETVTPPISASLLPMLSRRPVVALVQMLGGADMARKYRIPFHLVERWAVRLYRHFITLNELDRAMIEKYAHPATCHLIPNGAYRPALSESEFGTGDHLLFLGRIDVEQKGLDLLLAAVRRHRPALPLVVAGSGTAEEERKLRRLVAAAGPGVGLVGRVDGSEKERLLRSCAAVVVPSRFETFSLSALDAMAYGKPVVHFDLPQLRWIGDDCGIRVPAFDEAALGRALHDIAADPQWRARLGRRGYARSRDYDWDAVSARYRAVLDAVLAEDRHGRGQ